MRSPISRRVLGAVGGVLLLGLLGLFMRSPSGEESTAARPTRPPGASGNAREPQASPPDARAPGALPRGASGTLTLAGQVLGPDGPVVGALVVARPAPSAAWSALHLAPGTFEDLCIREASTARFLEQVEALQQEAPVLAQATTDAQGHFQLEHLGPEPLVLWAEKGLLLGVHGGLSAGGPEVRVRVKPGAQLSSQVLDDEGLPLEGVHVMTLVRAAGRVLDTTTDAEGRFVLGPLPDRDEPLVLSKPGFLSAKLGLSDPIREVTKLSPPRRISGRVLDERGPVARATVQFENELTVLLGTVTTDEHGRFTLEELCAGRYILTARWTGLVARQWLDVQAGREGPSVELLLTPAMRVSGQVTDRAGQALSEAEVSLYGGDPPRPLTTKTDARGRFVLEPITPGTYALRAQAPRHVPERLMRLFDASQELTFTLRPAETLEGRVLDERNAPVPGAQLALLSPLESDPDQPPALSDADGHFLLETPRAGDWQVEVSHPDFTPEHATLSAPARDLRLVLRQGASVEARVVDEEGRPVENTEVALASTEEGQWGRREHTDARGRAVFRAVPPGDYTVQACTADPGAQSPARVSLTSQESRTVPLRAPRQGRLTGHVVDAQGQPVQGANLRLLLTSTMPENCYAFANLQSGAEGYFSVALAPGIWTLHASTPDLVLDAEASRGVQAEEGHVTEHGVSVQVRVTADAAPIRLVLRPPRGRVRGRVVHEDGRPVTPFQLNGREVLHAEGRFAVPLREETLTIEAPGLAPFGRNIPAALPPKDIDLGEIVLRPLRRLEGTVVDGLSAAPIARALVRIQGQEEHETSRQAPMTYTRQDGHFVLEGVRPNDTSLGILHPLYPPVDVSFTPGQRVEVRLMPGATLEGRVESGGVPVEVGSVQLFTREDGVSVSTELRWGRYLLELVPAGRYTVHVQDPRAPGPSSRFPERTVNLTAGGRTVLDFGVD